MSMAIGVTSWISWVVNLLIVEWWLHRRPDIYGTAQRRSSRITTRGNPPETALVSAALSEAGVLKELASAHIGHGEVDLLAPVVHGVTLDRWRTL